jgi:hypothetical protein
MRARPSSTSRIRRRRTKPGRAFSDHPDVAGSWYGSSIETIRARLEAGKIHPVPEQGGLRRGGARLNGV